MSPFHFCLSATKNLSSFQLLPASLIIYLLQLFLSLPLFLFPWGLQNRAAFDISPSSFLNVWPIHLNFLFLISKFISSWPVAFYRSLLEIIFGHNILSINLRHLFTKSCILRWNLFVTSQVSHPYKSTDFTQALNIFFHKTISSRLIPRDNHLEPSPPHFKQKIWHPTYKNTIFLGKFISYSLRNKTANSIEFFLQNLHIHRKSCNTSHHSENRALKHIRRNDSRGPAIPGQIATLY